MSQSSEMLSKVTAVVIAALGQASDLAAVVPTRVPAGADLAHCLAAATPLPRPDAGLARRVRA